MDVAAVLTDMFSRATEVAEQVVDGLDEAQLTHRPDAEANSIAWLVWHVGRMEDLQVAHLAGTDQVWTEQGWADRFGLPFADSDIGYGHTPEEAGQVRGSVEDLLGYTGAVRDRTVAYLATLGPADLDRVVDENWDPPVTLGVRLVSVADDACQHMGQAAYVRGLVDRLGR